LREKKKKETMKNKYKFKGDRMYIENDLSFEERKIKGKMNRRAKEERSKGKMKVGRSRVKREMNSIEGSRNEERLRKEGRGQETKDKGTTEQNFG